MNYAFFLILSFSLQVSAQNKWDVFNIPSTESIKEEIEQVMERDFNNEMCNKNQKSLYACIKMLNKASEELYKEGDASFLHFKLSLENNGSVKISSASLPIFTNYNDFYRFKNKEKNHIYSIYQNLTTTLSFANQLKQIISKADPNKQNYIMASALSEFKKIQTNDPHFFYGPEEYFFPKEHDDQYYGMGAYIEKSKESNYVLIKTVMDGSPAQKAGIIDGEKVIAIKTNNNSEFQTTEDLTTQQAADLIKGKENTNVYLEMLDGRIIKITRGKTILSKNIEIQNTEKEDTEKEELVLSNSNQKIEAKITPPIASKTSVIKYDAFHAGSSSEFKVSLESIKEKGHNNIILDLRGNGGGNLFDAVRIASYFLGPDVPVVLTRSIHSADGDKLYKSGEEKVFDGNLIVLINRHSASASEILSGALQDHDRAVIIGENSFGKGSTQDLSPSFAYEITEIDTKTGVKSSRIENSVIYTKRTDRYFLRPSMRSPESMGIFPDIEVINPSLVNVEAMRSKDLENNSLKPIWHEVKKSNERQKYLDDVRECSKGMIKPNDKILLDFDLELETAKYVIENCM